LRSWSALVITSTTCLLFGGAAWRLSPHPSGVAAAQERSTSTKQAVSPAVASQSGSKSGALLQPASISAVKQADIPGLQPTAAPGTEIYTAKRGESIPTVAHRYLNKTSYLTSSELAEAIRQANGKPNGDHRANILKANETVIIPGILPAPIVEKTVPVAKDFEVRAIYLTGIMAASDHGLRIIRHWREVGGNAIVFDIKDSDGSVTIPFEHPLLGKHQVYIHDVPKFIHFVHQQNMHAIARVAIFRDERLVKEHPELAVQSKKTKQAWRENGKLVWTDPSQPKVQDYDIALAKYVAQLGADEIQFDYVRFPAEGDQKDASFAYQAESANSARGSSEPSATERVPGPCGEGRLARSAEAKQGGADTAAESSDSLCTIPAANANSDAAPQGRKNAARGASRGIAAENDRAALARQKKPGRSVAAAKPAALRGPQRSDVITAFLKKAYAEIHPTGALLSLDVFGVMAWQRPVDLAHTGQDIVGMAKYCDVLSPMIYPSHFFGMDNIAHPGDAPEHFIGESMDRFELITRVNGEKSTGGKSSGVVIRPWLQAFHWRTKTYSPEYIKVQVATAKEKGGIGFLFWNAANDYSKPFTAMPEMRAADLKEGPNGKPRFFRGDELPGTTVKASLAPTVVPAAAPAEPGSH
jgi:hypothetical protein